MRGPVYIIKRFPKVTMYLLAIAVFQTFYTLILIKDRPGSHFFKSGLGNLLNFSSENNSTTVNATSQTSNKYNTNNRDFIQLLDNICPRRATHLKEFLKADCPCPPTKLKLRVKIQNVIKDVPFKDMPGLHPLVKEGGTYTPPCNPIQRIAIIIPMRARESHLRMYLNYMHPFLQRQGLSYTIFVAEQVAGGTFNKARIMNSGFHVAFSKFGPFDCYIFNDVDMFPEDDRNIYACARGVRHLGSHVSKFGYRLAYEGLFGGAIGLSGEQFKKVNGFSNTFVGWGGEDDDMYRRVRTRHFPVVRFSTVQYYFMLKHSRDKGNPNYAHGSKAWRWLKAKQYDAEGLNTLTYTLEKLEKLPMYTRILISFDQKKVVNAPAKPKVVLPAKQTNITSNVSATPAPTSSSSAAAAAKTTTTTATTIKTTTTLSTKLLTNETVTKQ